MSRLMAHDVDTIGYTIGGRKYVGWEQFSTDMQEEFAFVSKLELPIIDLHLWTRDDLAWFAMELDYVRYVGSGSEASRTVIPLRETGVLERRNGQWILLSWHESLRQHRISQLVADRPNGNTNPSSAASSVTSSLLNLGGEWEIQEMDSAYQVAEKTYKANLDANGNGPYTHQGGKFVTTTLADRLWQGTWHQTGNDREGGFEIVLSEDSTQAKGIWWYTRVGQRNNIPPREHGGTYLWKRLTPPPAQTR